MHTRRLATFLLGLWLGGIVFMGVIATHNLLSSQDIARLAERQSRAALDSVGPDNVIALLRFQAAELNRWYFNLWGIVQVLIGLGVALLLAKSFGVSRWMIAVASSMLTGALIQALFITPKVVDIGRILDFAAPSAYYAERAAFKAYHAAYSTIELLKLLAGLVLSARLVYSTRPRRRRPAPTTTAPETLAV
jgi:hypothetical protein